MNKTKILLKELYLTYPIKDLFHTLTKDLVIKIDEKEYPNSIFFFNKDNEIIFEYDKNNGYFWCNYKKYWTIFYEKFNYNYNQVKYLTKDMVENHFKINEITPMSIRILNYLQVENHFKINEITPSILKTSWVIPVENHFKINEITPYPLNIIH